MMAAPSQGSPVVQSVDRAFSLLDALAKGPAGLTELAMATGLPKSTASRLLATLEKRGVVARIPEDGRYRLGARLAELAGAVSPVGNLVALARPHLVELAEAVGEATGLSIADGYEVLYLDQVESPNPVQVRDWTGAHLPLHVVPSGIVMLAHWPKAAQDRYLDRDLAAFTPATVTHPERLRVKLDAARAAGFAWGLEEYVEGIDSVAAPILDPGGAVVGAIHAHGPAYRFPPEGRADELASLTVKTANRIAARLQHGG